LLPAVANAQRAVLGVGEERRPPPKIDVFSSQRNEFAEAHTGLKLQPDSRLEPGGRRDRSANAARVRPACRQQSVFLVADQSPGTTRRWGRGA